MVDAVAAALKWAEARRPGGVVAVGLSAGAHLVAAASTTRGARPAAVALCSGVFDLEEHYAHESRRGVHDVSALGTAYACKTRAYSPICGKTSDKVFLVHGAADTTVPLDDSQRLAEATGLQMELVEGGSHGLGSIVKDGRLAEWLRRVTQR